MDDGETGQSPNCKIPIQASSPLILSVDVTSQQCKGARLWMAAFACCARLGWSLETMRLQYVNARVPRPNSCHVGKGINVKMSVFEISN
jgi:hypothetical protein